MACSLNCDLPFFVITVDMLLSIDVYELSNADGFKLKKKHTPLFGFGGWWASLLVA